MDQEQAGQHFGVQTPKRLSSCGRVGFGRQRVERRNKIGGKSLARSCLIFNSPGWGYSAIWHDSATQESAESTIWSRWPASSRCQQLVRAGYRPATIAVVEMSPGQPLVTASVWHRPVVGFRIGSNWPDDRRMPPSV